MAEFLSRAREQAVSRLFHHLEAFTMNKPKQHLAAIALVVRDYDEAKNYYSAVLGFDLVADIDQGNGKRWLGTSLCMRAPRPRQKRPSIEHYYDILPREEACSMKRATFCVLNF